MALSNSTITMHPSLCSQDPGRSTGHRIFTFVASHQNGCVCPNKSGTGGFGAEGRGRRRVSGSSQFRNGEFLIRKEPPGCLGLEPPPPTPQCTHTRATPWGSPKYARSRTPAPVRRTTSPAAGQCRGAPRRTLGLRPRPGPTGVGTAVARRAAAFFLLPRPRRRRPRHPDAAAPGLGALGNVHTTDGSALRD